MPPLPRYYPKSETSIDYDNILAAIKAIKIEKQSYRVVAGAFNLSKTNLARYIAKLNELNIDVATAETDVLMDVIKDSSKAGAKPVNYSNVICFFNYNTNKISSFRYSTNNKKEN